MVAFAIHDFHVILKVSIVLLTTCSRNICSTYSVLTLRYPCITFHSDGTRQLLKTKRRSNSDSDISPSERRISSLCM